MNLTMVISKVVAIFKLLPTLIAGMAAIQQNFPGIPGVQKLDILKGILQAAYTAEQNLALAFDDIWPTLEATVAKIKSSGLFGTKEAPQIPKLPE